VKVDELTGFSHALSAQLSVGFEDEVVESCRASIMRVGIAMFMIASISPSDRASTSATGILEPSLTMFLEYVVSIAAEAVDFAEVWGRSRNADRC
jgi:hypothetical protein